MRGTYHYLKMAIKEKAENFAKFYSHHLEYHVKVKFGISNR